MLWAVPHLKKVTLRTYQDFTTMGHFTSLLLLWSQDLLDMLSYTINLEIRCVKSSLEIWNGQYLIIVVFLSHTIMKLITVKLTIIFCCFKYCLWFRFLSCYTWQGKKHREPVRHTVSIYWCYHCWLDISTSSIPIIIIDSLGKESLKSEWHFFRLTSFLILLLFWYFHLIVSIL